MRASLTRDGREVGVFGITRDGDYLWDCHEEERERFEDSVTKIIQDLRSLPRGAAAGAR